MNSFTVEGKEIGLGKPCFIIAELGYNFVDEKEMLAAVDAAPDAGCDSIKLQTFRADIDFAHEQAYLPYGVIGIKVWIYRGNVYQDKKAPVRMPDTVPAHTA